jgi:hypothetical protein
MRDYLGIISAGIGFLIMITLINHNRHSPQTFMVVSSPIELEQKIPEDSKDSPETLVMPKPVLISSQADLLNIADLKIRSFIRANSSFKKDNILYFEWKGHSDEKLIGKEIQNEQDKKSYLIRYLYCDSCKDGDNRLHKQVFVVPKTMDYEMKMENLH